VPATSSTSSGASATDYIIPVDDQPVHYMVNFVCGFQDVATSGEPPVKPGNYATAINIHNYSEQTITLVKRPALHYNDLDGSPPASYDKLSTEIAPLSVLEVDCNDIWAQTGIEPGTFTKGMIDLGMSAQLPVVAIYTSSIVDTMSLTNTGAGISMDIEYIEPFIPHQP